MNMREIITLIEGTNGVIVRPVGWNAANDEPWEWTRRGHLYRGMSAAEYDATVGAGAGVRSDSRYCFNGEGTCFAEDAPSAESYINCGHTDPRKTGLPTYVVEIDADGSGAQQDRRDGYWKAPSVPQDRARRVWRMSAEDGAVVAHLVRNG